MSTFCVVVANRVRARFFTVEEAEVDEVDKTPWLLERENLANADLELTPDPPPHSEPSSAHHGAQSGPARASANPMEIRPRFVRQIASVTAAFIKRNTVRRVAFIAAPDLLDLLRQQAEELLPREVQRVELMKDLCNHTLAQIQSVLTLHGILPAAPALKSAGPSPFSLRFEPRSNPV